MPRKRYRVNVANPPRLKPIMIWDGDCHFCGKWSRRWEQATNGDVEFQPYQAAAQRFPEISEDDFSKAVYFIGLDGIALRGAEAVFACLAFADRYRFLQGLYERYSWFASVSELLYGYVAANRMLFSRLTSIFWGRSVEYSTYRFSGALFQRGLGLIYLIAFLSFAMQMAGLIGSQGILPVGEHVEAVNTYLEQQPGARSPMSFAPSLLWLEASDTTLNILVWGGAVCALLLFFGLLPGLSAFLAWLCYLSLVNAVPVFLSYQWDMLLLEAGFIGFLLAPWVLRERFLAPREPNRIARWLVWWLLFRLMFESGAVKLLEYHGSVNTWKELTALNFHYFTQPIPNPRSWAMHWLPNWFQQASIIFMFFVELVVPFFIFFPRRLRTVSCVLLIALQVLIIATGNFGFFNLLTIVLCLLLLDDQVLPRSLQARLRKAPPDSDLQNAFSPIGWVRVPVAALCLFFGLLQIGHVVRVVDFAEYKSLDEPKQPPWTPIYDAMQSIHAINYYGLFRVMTTSRPEIIIEGSDDMHTWQPYVFNYKPGPLDRRPGWATPHMPRLDWQLWFAALDAQHGKFPAWFPAFLRALAENRPEVTALLADNPFKDAPPKYLRVRLYQYTFTTPEQQAVTGDWWQREEMPGRIPILRTDQLKTPSKP